MTLDLIEKGLRLLIINEQHSVEAKQALAEITEINQRVGRDDSFKDECYILHASTVIDLLNIATYDAYGKRYTERKRIGQEINFNDYEKICREQYGLENAPLSAIQVGYDVVGDLYRDNEALGCHYPDGTFKGDLPAEDYIQNASACLEQLIVVANSDADHDISIKIDNKEYRLYDLAALVSSLADAMKYFISEIS